MHYVVWVLIPEEGDTVGHVRRLITPYDENTQDSSLLVFEDIEDEQRAKFETEGTEMVILPDGSAVFTWDERWRIPGSIGYAYGNNKRDTGTHRIPDEHPIRQVLHRDRYSAFEEFMRDYCGQGQRDPKTGRFGFWHNPRGHWDYWRIGGRWTGMFDGYDPEKDPANVETCPLCSGTGIREDSLARALRVHHPSYTCNGCNGTGRSIKWPTAWAPHQGDIVSAVVALSAVKHEGQLPEALVSPDGEWTAEERVVDGELVDFDGDWLEFVKAQLGKHTGRVVVVDCHI